MTRSPTPGPRCPIVGAPSARTAHTAVSSGQRMLIWGGSDISTPALGTGGRYDPATDSWTAISPVNAPSPRREQSAVWTGDRMIVWGGNTGGDHVLNTGGRYDPSTNTWTPTSVGGTPLGRSIHTAVWTGALDDRVGRLRSGRHAQHARLRLTLRPGDRHLVADLDLRRAARSVLAHRGLDGKRHGRLGGYAGYPAGYTTTGARYDPIADTWTPTSTAGAPAGCYYQQRDLDRHLDVGVGGFDGSFVKVDTGEVRSGRGHVARNVRRGALTARASHAAAWTGHRMVIWGGGDFTTSVNTGGRYDPLTDTWASTSLANAPSARTAASAVWTGDRVIVWGGLAGHYNAFDTGAGTTRSRTRGARLRRRARPRGASSTRRSGRGAKWSSGAASPTTTPWTIPVGATTPRATAGLRPRA